MKKYEMYVTGVRWKGRLGKVGQCIIGDEGVVEVLVGWIGWMEKHLRGGVER